MVSAGTGPPARTLGFCAALPCGFRDALRCLRVTFDGKELQSDAFASRGLPWARHMRAPRSTQAAWRRAANVLERTIRYAPDTDVENDRRQQEVPRIDCAASVQSDPCVACVVPADGVKRAVSRIRSALRGLGLSAFTVTMDSFLADHVLEDVLRGSLLASLVASERWSTALDGTLLLGAFTSNAVPGRWVNLAASADGLKVCLAPDGGDAVALGLGNPCMARLRHLPVAGLGRQGPAGTQCFPLPSPGVKAWALELVTPSPEGSTDAAFTDAKSGRTSWTVEELRAFWRETHNVELPRGGFDVVRVTYDKKESGNSYIYPAPCLLGAPVGASGILGQIQRARSQLSLALLEDAPRMNFAGFPQLLESIEAVSDGEAEELVPSSAKAEEEIAHAPASSIDEVGPYSSVWPYLNDRGEVAPPSPPACTAAPELHRNHRRTDSLRVEGVALPPLPPPHPLEEDSPQGSRHPWSGEWCPRVTQAGDVNAAVDLTEPLHSSRHEQTGSPPGDVKIHVSATPDGSSEMRRGSRAPTLESLERFRYTPPQSAETATSLHAPPSETSVRRKVQREKRTLRTQAMPPGAAFAAMDACMKAADNPPSSKPETVPSSRPEDEGGVESPPHKVARKPRQRIRHTDMARGMQLGEAEEIVRSTHAAGGAKALKKLPERTLSTFLEAWGVIPSESEQKKENLLSLVQGVLDGDRAGS